MLLNIRKAQDQDANLAYTWRNHPTVRQSSFDKKPINFETHMQWFKQSLMMKDRHMLVLLDDSKPVGFLRFDVKDDIAKVNIYIAPEAQGNGYGTKGLECGVGWIKKNLPTVKELEADILPDNLISQKAFARTDFILHHHVYRLNL